MNRPTTRSQTRALEQTLSSSNSRASVSNSKPSKRRPSSSSSSSHPHVQKENPFADQEDVLFQVLQNNPQIQEDVVLLSNQGTNGWKHALAKGGFAMVFPATSKHTGEPLVLKVEIPIGFTYLNRERRFLNTQMGKSHTAQLRGYYPCLPIPEEQMHVFTHDPISKKKHKAHIQTWTSVLSMVRYGPTLREWALEHFSIPTTTKQEWVPVGCAASLGIQMVRTVHSLHTSNVLLLDVSPLNFLIDEARTKQALFPHLRLIDLGASEEVAKKRDEGTVLPGVEGTHPFPSIAGHLFQPLTPKDDLESIGFLLWWLSAGRLPWQNKEDNAIVLRMKLQAVYGDPKQPFAPAVLPQDVLARIHMLQQAKRLRSSLKSIPLPVPFVVPSWIRMYFRILHQEDSSSSSSSTNKEEEEDVTNRLVAYLSELLPSSVIPPEEKEDQIVCTARQERLVFGAWFGE